MIKGPVKTDVNTPSDKIAFTAATRTNSFSKPSVKQIQNVIEPKRNNLFTDADTQEEKLNVTNNQQSEPRSQMSNQNSKR